MYASLAPGSVAAGLKEVSSSFAVFLTTDVAVEPRPSFEEVAVDVAVLGLAYFEAPLGSEPFLAFVLVILAEPLVREAEVG